MILVIEKLCNNKNESLECIIAKHAFLYFAYISPKNYQINLSTIFTFIKIVIDFLLFFSFFKNIKKIKVDE
jgi:hypothetical protein